MRKHSSIGVQSRIFDCDWFSCGNDISEAATSNEISSFCMQDTPHIGTKLRNLFLKTIKNEKKKIPFGKYFIKQSDLRYLINKYSKDKHNLTNSTLNPEDKQNFGSVQRICNKKVIELLRNKVADSHGTSKFLEIIQYIIDSFMNNELSPLERIYKIWYAVFIIRIWRAFIVSKKNIIVKIQLFKFVQLLMY